MEITQSTRQQVTVLQQRKISVGNGYCISASQGYLGITDGLITVADIIMEPTHPVTSVDCDIDGLVTAWLDAEIQDINDSYGQARYDELVSVPWVLYYYPYDKNERGEYYVMPVDTFIEHTSMR
jgi:hypothetical protein